jgi:uncharacterized protein (DUF302 family)
MDDKSVTATYLVPEPYDDALRRLRRALAASDLSVSSELDISARLHSELGVRLNSARILYVDCPVLMLEAMALYGPMAVFIPLHLVVCDRNGKTEIHFMHALRFGGSAVPAAVRGPVYRLQARLAAALQKIAMPQGVCDSPDADAGVGTGEIPA